MVRSQLCCEVSFSPLKLIEEAGFGSNGLVTYSLNQVVENRNPVESEKRKRPIKEGLKQKKLNRKGTIIKTTGGSH